MTKNSLLKIARIQQIDMALCSKGLTRQFIYEKIIYPSFFIERRTYYNYLDVNAKKELREAYGLDWEEALNEIEPVDYIKLMRELNNREFFDLVQDENLSAAQRSEIIKSMNK